MGRLGAWFLCIGTVLLTGTVRAQSAGVRYDHIGRSDRTLAATLARAVFAQRRG